MIHTIKCTPDDFSILRDGSKNIVILENDRLYRAGDFLAVNEFGECDPTECIGYEVRCANGGVYSGKSAIFKITHIISDSHYLQNGMVILCLKPCYKSE